MVAPKETVLNQAFNSDLGLECPGALEFLESAKALGYVVEDKPGTLNIVGWRNMEARTNRYDDFLSVYYRNEEENPQHWFTQSWEITTYPGIPWLKWPMNKKGTAILVPGQYLNAYKLGKHRGYWALKQVAPVWVYRDSNRDEKVDLHKVNIESGLFGINIHKGDFIGRFINRNSAGCQVFKNSHQYEEFIKLCAERGETFTYTLMEL